MSDKPRLVIAMDFSDELITHIREAAPQFRVERHFPEVPESVWADTEILYTLNRFPQPAQAPALRWIQFHFAGVDRALNQAIVRLESIEVTTASGIHATSIAEYCIGMMLAFNLKLPLMLQHQAGQIWHERRYEIFRPSTLRGKTLGVIGYGSIGRELARIAHSMGMRILAAKRNAMKPEDDGYTEPGTGDPAGDLPERIYPWQALTQMVSECDYLAVITPLTDATRKLINEDVIKAMKKTAVILNVARGEVIDQAALIAALNAQKIGGAILDVFEEEPLPAHHPLWTLDNVIISPHVSGNHTDYNTRAAQLLIENLKRYMQHQPLYNRLDRREGY
ncbi:MAG: D-2-hydroxyacid dehydrogenase [Anaerolineae bacterium]|jgi:phosphoglycerate dehydrogenase-like enzyme|nr:D-2-hydroxyacid dehydrogenase [Anaerolineae bacterium]